MKHFTFLIIDTKDSCLCILVTMCQGIIVICKSHNDSDVARDGGLKRNTLTWDTWHTCECYFKEDLDCLQICICFSVRTTTQILKINIINILSE